MNDREGKLAEGKTKIIWATDDPAIVLIESKDDITAGDGAKHDLLEGKAVLATTTTCNVFELLNKRGIKTHYLDRVDDRTFRACNVEMIPLELVIRRLATGSYLKRHPDAVEGEIFEALVFEIFHKDDSAHDPLLQFDYERGVVVRYPAGQPLGAEPIDTIPIGIFRLGNDPEDMINYLGVIAKRVFVCLELRWSEENVQLVDLKIECGWAMDELVVADVIDNDSWRIWPAGDKTQMLDKQVYRELAGAGDPGAMAKELGAIKRNYARVAEMTGQFV